MAFDQFWATIAGIKQALSFTAENYLISGVIYNFQQGRRVYFEDEVHKRDSIEEILADFEEVAIEELRLAEEGFETPKEELAKEIVEQVGPYKHEVYPVAASILFGNDSSDSETLPVLYESNSDSGFRVKKEKTLLCMVLAREQVRLTKGEGTWNGETRADLSQRLRREIGVFNFVSPGEDELRFLATFESLSEAIRSGTRDKNSRDNPVYVGEPNEPEKVYRDFVHTFLPFLDYPEFDAEGKSEQERLRSKVVQIVRQGELNTAAAGRNILKIIREEEERILQNHKTEQAFMVFSQHWYGERQTEKFKKRLQRKYPYHVETSGGRYGYSTPKFDDQEQFYLTKHIIFPEQEYSSAKDFYERGIAELIPDGQFVAVLETSNTSPYFPQSEEELLGLAQNPGHIQNAIEGIEFFETTRPPENVTSRALDNLVGDEIEVKEMLRSLRIDVLIPGLTQDEERVLRENREQFEKEFEISDVFDWRKKNPDDVGGYLYYLDNETDNTESDWKKNAEILIQTSEDWFRATETISR